MPELIEVELYRRALDPLIGSIVESVDVRHPAFVRPAGAPVQLFAQIVGLELIATERIGKLLLLKLGGHDDPFAVGLRFGMTGRLLIDGSGPIEQLEYASDRNDEGWDRVVFRIGSVTVAVRDQRRLGSIELDPDLASLGPDAASLVAPALVRAIGSRTKALKALLLDQTLVSGLGNLLVDEILWRAAIDPRTPVSALSSPAIVALADTIRATVHDLTKRGGSHTGDTFVHRVPGARCPRCAHPMQRDQVGGRTTWWCPEHQR